MDEVRQGQLIDEAWNILGQLVETGRASLKNGKVIVPEDEALVRHFQWMASHKKPRKGKTGLPEDYVLQETQQRKE